MTKIALLTGLAVTVAACGGEKNAAKGESTSVAVSTPAPAAGATHDVNMVLEGTSYKFVPADLSIKVGDKVVFHNVSGGPHNVSFWPDSIPAGGKEVLEPQMPDEIGPLQGALLVDPNASVTLSFANAPAGVYKIYCTPHLAMKMTGTITVTQ
ncbi:MAG TPA: plastocyanin/azurin family copper-binding protein [Gemmatimonadales bacterium]|jgi:plastocyanin|nr:plastocyanin/azurin family copper-binding protein [Gemmatimonadales bacterium]